MIGSTTRWVLAMFLLCVLGTAHAAQRVALVIGNGAYQHVTNLPNPANDAAAMTRTLKGLGFQVTEVRDAGKGAMERGVLQFGRQASGADVAMVYYAGHGMQVDGRNYLIPVDARLEDDLSLREEAVDLDLLLSSVSSAETRLIFLDACRDNPFSRRMKMSNATRSVGRGLARVESAAGGTLIAFATDPDNVADDGSGGNSPFAAALLEYLPQPGLEIRQVMGRVRLAVANATNRRQIPWENSSLFGDLYLAGGAGETQVAALTRPRPNSTQAPSTRASAPAPVTQSQYGAGGVLLRPASLSGLSAGTVFRDCEDCPEMVRVPTGRFEMGSPSYEADRQADEGPVHEVNIGYALAVGKFEVTRGQWRQFITESGKSYGNGCNVWDTTQKKWVVENDKSWRDPGYAQDDSHPAVCMTWQWAKDYTAWLSRKTGKQYRLLSEAEFEYVNRAGTSTPWFWGSDPNQACRYSNNTDTRYAQWRGWSGVTGGAKCDDGYAQTSPVGRYQPNAFGLYDTTGNVWEWTEDCWNEGFVGAPSNGAVWAAGECARRVMRGGSWDNRPAYLRAALRDRTSAGATNSTRGFRLARTD